MADISNETSVFDAVKESVSLEDYFGDYLKVDLRPTGPGQLKGLCPYHDEKTPSFTVFSDDHSFHCFGCEKNGSIIDAVMFKEGFEEPIEALQWLNKEYGLGLKQDSKSYSAFKGRVDTARKDAEKAQKDLWDKTKALSMQAMKALKGRGLNDKTMKDYELGVSDKYGGTIMIPIRDKGNHIVTVSTRAIWNKWECKECGKFNSAKEIFVARDSGEDPTHCIYCGKATIPKFFVFQHPKYRHEKGFPKARVLYNEPVARDALFDKEKNTPLFIMEGFPDVWACVQSGFPTAVAYNGPSISTEQAQEAIKITKRAQKTTKKPNKYIVFIPDFDNTGRSKVAKNISQIRRIDPKTEIKILYGIDEYSYTNAEGEETPCKDVGELLEHHGEKVVAKVLRENRMSADEYRIREILDYDHWTKEMQIQLVAEILAQVQHTIELDNLVPEIAKKWNVPEAEVKRFLHSEVAHKESSLGASLISTIEDAHEAAVEYLKDGFAIQTGFPTIDQCLPGGGFKLRQLSLWLGKSGVGKTNLILNLIRNMCEYQNLPVVFFSLEQPKAQLYMRLVQMILGVNSEQANEIVKKDDIERLKTVDEKLKNLMIVDGVPDEGTDRPQMTPATIARFIQEVNLTRFSRPTAAVFIDHLSMCKAGESAPRHAREDENALAGYLMEEFFIVCKETNTLFIVLQQLPKDVRPGKEFSYDAGRGGSRQTDFSDYIFCLWRPEQDEELDEDERMAVEGQYKIKIGKNRHGMSKTAHCVFDWHNLRIDERGNITHIPGAGENRTGQVGDTMELVDELIEEAGGDIGMPELTTAEDVPSWFDK